MSDPTASLARLRSQFLKRCLDDAGALAAYADDPAHPEVRRLAHRLAGTAGSFGFSEIGSAADALLETGISPQEARMRLGVLVERLRA